MILPAWQRAALVGAPVPWTPLALGSTLEAWWEAGLGVTLAPESEHIAAWADQKNAHHWAQSTVSKGPTLEPGIFGEQPGIRFKAAESQRLNLMAGALISGLAAVHAFLIVKLAADPTAANADGLWGFSGGNATRFPYSDGTIYDNFGTNSRKTAGNPSPSLAAAHCYEVISASGEWTNRLDGAQITTTATNTVAWSAARQTIGADEGATSTYHLDGWIGALFPCNAKLVGSDLTNMRGFIARKYGVTFA